MIIWCIYWRFAMQYIWNLLPWYIQLHKNSVAHHFFEKLWTEYNAIIIDNCLVYRGSISVDVYFDSNYWLAIGKCHWLLNWLELTIFFLDVTNHQSLFRSWILQNQDSVFVFLSNFLLCRALSIPSSPISFCIQINFCGSMEFLLGGPLLILLNFIS